METQTTTARTALKFGIISGVAGIIFMTVLYVSGQAANTGLAWLGTVITIIVMVLAMKEFRTLNGGFMSYGQGLGIGTLMAGISGFLSAVYSYIYQEFIDTTLRQQILDKVREDLENRGMDDAQIEQAVEMTQKFSSPGITFAIGVIGSIFIGFIIALIISAIMKKDKPFEME
ncbi:DUF4199 domain-containing protein [Runella slithyformis]|uniref:DUF4199 domain-containing protein n=1 Tax=Runella slithyformis (strain ATCC 29530 / DSM 19594 / LMG 11500 / NCIMB 11436 / LSU 4) TaxID=761193 RepID=A0A7U3ZN33_RUNSL|nr:DUF4199 domain-containing protein [Runella slithyformis]AEI50207.1 hypothetical protein Runsl_3849 [Runella slithyformis DSM 19594]